MTQIIRPPSDVISELEELSRERGFIYTFSFIAFASLWTVSQKLDQIDWSERPNHRELSFLFGLMANYPIDLDYPESEISILEQNGRALSLLEELHHSYSHFKSHSVGTETLRDQSSEAEQISPWFDNGEAMVEPIFYGGEGASEFQFLEMVKDRYSKDRHWIESTKRFKLESMIEIPRRLKQIQMERVNATQFSDSLEDFCRQCFEIFVINIDESMDDIEDADNFFNAFSVPYQQVNSELSSIGTYNIVDSDPIIKLDDRQYYLLIAAFLARSVYESPSYWMIKDSRHADQAQINKGKVTEEISFKLLETVFGSENVYQNVKIKKNGHDETEIDVLVIFQNKAIVVQAKSKKLTEPSKQGDSDSLVKDFNEAIQASYDQCIRSRNALTRPEFEFFDKEGQVITIGPNLDDVYLICVLTEPYPALGVQIKRYLKRADGDPYPVAVSLFELEILTYYLRSEFDLLYYLDLRTRYSEQFASNSELALLAFHISCKLKPITGYELHWADEDLNQWIQTDYLVSKGYLPKRILSERLSWKWRTDDFNQLVRVVRESTTTGTVDPIFFLLDIAGDQLKDFISSIAKLQRATLRDGRPHDMTMPGIDKGRGISFASYPAPYGAGDISFIHNHFQSFAVARKYKSFASEWLALASIVGTTRTQGLIWYSKEPWQSDPELDEMTRNFLKPGRAINGASRKLKRKPSRNQPCPCGSGRKFKKCHGG